MRVSITFARFVSIRARHCWRAIPAGLSASATPRRVSIRARHCWRAIPHHPSPKWREEHVSIRARHCWRAIRQSRWATRRFVPVSIRARHCWRAILCSRRSQATRPPFQSAPAIAGGRSRCCRLLTYGGSGFQSAPAIAGGRSLCARDGSDGDGIVSIRARHCWRAILLPGSSLARFAWFQSAPAIAGGRSGVHSPLTRSSPCFNPRPPLLAGDPANRASEASTRLVSIRARHCWRAIHNRSLHRTHAHEFQSAPAIAGGRSLHEWDKCHDDVEFQSAPAIAGGRSACTRFGPWVMM